MAFVVKTLKALRNHWKKSTLAFGLTSYGALSLSERFKAHQLMQVYCQQAVEAGNQCIPVDGKSRHLTVILNPAAKKGKGKKLFEKYSAPLLHLAGIRVSVIQTEKEGDARDLMEVMDNTDAVVIVGGDGTVHEAVTGLLCRSDSDMASRRFPLGIIPIGNTNSLAKHLFQSETVPLFLAEASMAVINGVFKMVDTMKIQSDTGRPVYAVSRLDYGIFYETEAAISKYWYFGVWKRHFAYLFQVLKKWPPVNTVEFSYILPCSGCSVCATSAVQTSVHTSRHWWEVFQPVTRTKQEKVAVKDYSGTTNKDCGVYHTETVSCINFSVMPLPKISEQMMDTIPSSSLNVEIHQPEIPRITFMKLGLQRHEKEHISEASVRRFEVSELKLKPILEKDQKMWYAIDGDAYDVKETHTTVGPKIMIYCK